MNRDCDFVEEFLEDCCFYSSKCMEHLARVGMTHELGLEAIAGRFDNSGEEESSEPSDLMKQSFDSGSAVSKEKLIRALTETLFLSLKVNFEFYLYRMLVCNWEHFFDSITSQKRGKWIKQDVPLLDIANATILNEQDARNFVIEQAVVSQGLSALVTQIKDVSGIDVRDAIVKQDYATWAQIRTAFEIRHLLEHRKGKMDRRFLDKKELRQDWENSSWSDIKPAADTRIEIRVGDFDCTLKSMLIAVSIVNQSHMTSISSSE